MFAYAGIRISPRPDGDNTSRFGRHNIIVFPLYNYFWEDLLVIVLLIGALILGGIAVQVEK